MLVSIHQLTPWVADAILVNNFGPFVDLLSSSDSILGSQDVALIVDRFIQAHPPNFNSAARSELEYKLVARYTGAPDPDQPPSEVLAALDLPRLLADKPQNVLVLYIHRIGADFTKNEDVCATYLQSRPNNIQLSEEQVSLSLTYTTISQSPPHDPAVFVAAVRRVAPPSFRWLHVVTYFDQRGAKISSRQFLSLYKALLPVAQDPKEKFNITFLWGGKWENPETHLSFICAYSSLSPDELDATTIPGIQHTFSLDKYRDSPPAMQEEAQKALRHPLSSTVALNSIFHVALHSVHASQTTEARRLFQKVVVPNLDIFMISAFAMPKPWPPMANDTINSLFENFLYRISRNSDFVLHSLWKDDKQWVMERLTEVHAVKPIDLTVIFDHAVKQGWLGELALLRTGFGFDLAAYAHAEGYLNLTEWAHLNSERPEELAKSLLTFLSIKASMELQFQRPADGGPAVKATTSLQVRTVWGLLDIIQEILTREPLDELILVQRQCITVYPRLINYGEGFDEIIDANGKESNILPPQANAKMEEHYKKMYNDETQVRDVVAILERYKRSTDPLEQDIFACMIHGLFDEYSHYIDYPLEALATTAVLFGAIISHKLVSDLPLQIGLGMILEAVRDHETEDPMFKFGLQALIQLYSRFHEWPGFCRKLLAISGLRETDVWKKAEEVVRESEEETRSQQVRGAFPTLGGDPMMANGAALNDSTVIEPQAPQFVSINVDPLPPGVNFEDPDGQVRDRIQFCLNNLTETTLQTRHEELVALLDLSYHQWFAASLVEERAKMQPNYHTVYVDLVENFHDNLLWGQVLRQTFISVSRMLNSELTLTNTTERTHLKNLGGWLGLITLARNQPILHRNIAFKQLLIEAHDTKRLIIVIPFVCKVLVQGAKSKIFKPPNPWLMEVVRLLIELYHNAELKLNLKFEIEVLCKDLNLDHKTIDPSRELVNRASIIDTMGDAHPLEGTGGPIEGGYEGMLGMNGLGSTSGGASLSHVQMMASIPDLRQLIQIPPSNEMVVTQQKLSEMTRTALSKALQDIIQPVVERSVTIAAISTAHMIRKDFATEPDEERLRTSAVNMVKATAGSLALVTSKEPLRSNFTTNMRTLSDDLPQQGLPEGTIIMCVNSNLDLACSIIEKQAEDRAVPEIEEMLRQDFQARRDHRHHHPNDPFVDPHINRYAWAMPAPYRLAPSISGLNAEQMAIYENFARQPRQSGGGQVGAAHAASSSDATRSLANEVLGEYSSVPSLPPASTGSATAVASEQSIPTGGHLGSHMQTPYSGHSGGNMVGSTRGQPAAAYQFDLSAMADRVRKLFAELHKVATAEASVDHFNQLPRYHPVLDVVDALMQQVIKSQHSSEELPTFAAEQLCTFLLSHDGNTLLVESLVHVMESSRKISSTFNSRIISTIQQQPGHAFLHMPLIMALLPTDLLEWQRIDAALAKLLEQREEKALDMMEKLLEVTLLPERPIALFSDFIGSLESAWKWIRDEPELAAGQRLRDRLRSAGLGSPPRQASAESGDQRDQREYILDEWINICTNPNASPRSKTIFVKQLAHNGLVHDLTTFLEFLRLSFDICAARFEATAAPGINNTERCTSVDALVKFVMTFARVNGEIESNETALVPEQFVSIIDSSMTLTMCVVHSHHLAKGDNFHQGVYTRFLSLIFHETAKSLEALPLDCRRDFLISFANLLERLNPMLLPGFVHGWVLLVQHRAFFPVLLDLPDRAGWNSYAVLLDRLLAYLAPHLRQIQVHDVAKDLYRATIKLLVILHHDFQEFIVANGPWLALRVPYHCNQLINILLYSIGNSIDRPEALPDSFIVTSDTHSANALGLLEEGGLKDVLDGVMHDGVSEDAVANIALAMQQHGGRFLAFGNVPIHANLELMNAVVWYLGIREAWKVPPKNSGPQNSTGCHGASTLTLLVHELPAEARYFLLFSMIMRLRGTERPETHYYSRIIVSLFCGDPRDPEEIEIREQVSRIMMERLLGFWPQPMGVVNTFSELIRGEGNYQFFEMPYIKTNHDVSS